MPKMSGIRNRCYVKTTRRFYDLSSVRNNLLKKLTRGAPRVNSANITPPGFRHRRSNLREQEAKPKTRHEAQQGECQQAPHHEIPGGLELTRHRAKYHGKPRIERQHRRRHPPGTSPNGLAGCQAHLAGARARSHTPKQQERRQHERESIRQGFKLECEQPKKQHLVRERTKPQSEQQDLRPPEPLKAPRIQRPGIRRHADARSSQRRSPIPPRQPDQ